MHLFSLLLISWFFMNGVLVLLLVLHRSRERRTVHTLTMADFYRETRWHPSMG